MMIYDSLSDYGTGEYELFKQQLVSRKIEEILDGSRQFRAVMGPDVEKVGPKGYIHGWIKVGSGGDDVKSSFAKAHEHASNIVSALDSGGKIDPKDVEGLHNHAQALLAASGQKIKPSTEGDSMARLGKEDWRKQARLRAIAATAQYSAARGNKRLGKSGDVNPADIKNLAETARQLHEASRHSATPAAYFKGGEKPGGFQRPAQGGTASSSKRIANEVLQHARRQGKTDPAWKTFSQAYTNSDVRDLMGNASSTEEAIQNLSQFVDALR